MQAELNIGLLGHVDHGKTTLTKAITGKWTDTHSEEIKRGISIRMGYADASIYKCKKCGKHSFKDECTCGGKGEPKRKISFLDAPGHETLMTVVISASSIIDGALFLIAANEKCPQPQTTEHLRVLNSMGIQNVIVVQTKIDLASKERALESYREIKEFLKGSVAEKAPIIPVSANYGLNVSKLADSIEELVKTPKRDDNAKLRLYISRSFDVNRPGQEIAKLVGGVLGGSVMQGTLKVNDTIEIKPGINKDDDKFVPIICQVTTLMEESEKLDEAKPGGLIAIGTTLDPAITKSDVLVGSVIGHPNEVPNASNTLTIKYSLLKRTDMENPLLKEGEPLVVNVNTATSIGVIAKLSKGTATIRLKKPIVVEKNSRVAINRKFGQRWRLAGWGQLA